jgi:hypothetical protein
METCEELAEKEFVVKGGGVSQGRDHMVQIVNADGKLAVNQ